MLNKDQLKKLSDTFTVLAFAQFGVFGYDAYQQSQWLMLSLSSIIFIELQVVAIVILGIGEKHE